jgi:hypothetical protein
LLKLKIHLCDYIFDKAGANGIAADGFNELRTGLCVDL